MHSYLIVGNNKEEVDKEVGKLSKNLKAQQVNFELAKIGDVRELGKFTRLKVNLPTAIVIKGIDKATPEAANAFLKNLEEPQENIYYILTADSEHKILPTILSRCQIVRANVNNQVLEETEVRKFVKMTTSGKLAHVALIKKREEAIEFVENLILVTHTYLHAKNLKDYPKVANYIENSQSTLLALKANGNVSLQLTNFVLNVQNN